MGQKVNPNGLRFGIYKSHNAIWFAKDKDYVKNIVIDYKIRKIIEKKYERKLEICGLKIHRKNNTIGLWILTPKVGLINGEKGKMLRHIKNSINRIIPKENKLYARVFEEKNMYLNAKWVANDLAKKIEKRQSFKNIQKKAIQNAMKSGAKGIKTLIKGRLGGNDIARSESYSQGIIPLNTLRSKIDYAASVARTTYGAIGIKIWICSGEYLFDKNKKIRKVKD